MATLITLMNLSEEFSSVMEVVQNVEICTEIFSSSDVKLRIVTIVERPFIIRNEHENGSIYYTGCCVDMLNAIQEELRHKLGGKTFQYEMYEVADNKYGIVDPITRKWNGLIGWRSFIN